MSIGYTVVIVGKRPNELRVFCHYADSHENIIKFAENEMNNKYAPFPASYITIRLGTASAQDPIIWDSRRDYKPKPADTHWLDKIIKQQADHYGMTVEQQSRLMHDVALYLEDNPE